MEVEQDYIVMSRRYGEQKGDSCHGCMVVSQRRDAERGKREVSYDQQVEMGSDSSQLHAKGFVGRRRKWGYQKEIKMGSAAYL